MSINLQFVDVIHTDARSFFLLEIPGYGMSQQCGTIGELLTVLSSREV